MYIGKKVKIKQYMYGKLILKRRVNIELSGSSCPLRVVRFSSCPLPDNSSQITASSYPLADNSVDLNASSCSPSNNSESPGYDKLIPSYPLPENSSQITASSCPPSDNSASPGYDKLIPSYPLPIVRCWRTRT